MIDGIDFHEMLAQKYWSFPSGYKKDSKQETKDMIFSENYIGARKIDGAFYKFIKHDDGTMELLGRSKSVNGDYLNKIDWVPQLESFFNALPNGTCLLGELYFPDNEGSHNVTTIMGCLVAKARQRQEEGNKLHYYIFDVLAYDGKSLYQKNVEDRITYLYEINTIRNTNYNEYIDIAKYYEGKELWNILQKILADNGEGVVITKKGTCYQPGKRPARQTLKIKKELQDTIDCFFTGVTSKPTRPYTGKEIETWIYWENLRTGEKIQGQLYKEYVSGTPIEPITNGWAGSLEIGVVKEDKVVPIGYISGLTDEIKANPQAYKGKCIEVTAMQFTDDGMLRHAKLTGFRPDLTIRDCTWEKIYANE